MITSTEEILAFAENLNPIPTVILANGSDHAALEALYHAVLRGMVKGIVTGDIDKINIVADELSIDTRKLTIVDFKESNAAIDGALNLIRDGKADILMKGHSHTSEILKAVLRKEYGFRSERALSHVAVANMARQDRVVILSDAGANLEPDLARKKDILLNCVDVAHAFGNECPKVALLSFIEKKTPDSPHASIQDACSLTEMNQKGQITGCVVEGAYSLDVALSRHAAHVKGVDGQVAGQADVLITNDIGVGNILYKAIQLWGNGPMAGIIAGAKIPIVITSRADSMETKLCSIALAVVMWQNK